jgi:hypothetical protein
MKIGIIVTKFGKGLVRNIIPRPTLYSLECKLGTPWRLRQRLSLQKQHYYHKMIVLSLELHCLQGLGGTYNFVPEPQTVNIQLSCVSVPYNSKLGLQNTIYVSKKYREIRSTLVGDQEWTIHVNSIKDNLYKQYDLGIRSIIDKLKHFLKIKLLVHLLIIGHEKGGRDA